LPEGFNFFDEFWIVWIFVDANGTSGTCYGRMLIFFENKGIARMSAQDAKIVLKLFVSSQPDLFLANV
jgi:hypothetical protein